jgi:D-ribose pyranase
LVDDVPTVRQVLAALKESFTWGAAFMAMELTASGKPMAEGGNLIYRSYAGLVAPVTIQFEPHVEFKRRVPQAVGLIRTADTTQYGNIILESA